MTVSPNNDDLILSQYFNQYRNALKGMSFDKNLLQYNWYTQSSTDIMWLPYFTYLKSFSGEIINSLHRLHNNIRKLEAWENVTRSCTPQQLIILKMEFIDDLAEISLQLPYAIRSRFIIAVSILSHQANRTKDNWVDVAIETDKINMNEMDEFGNPWWKTYRVFKDKLEAINGSKFRKRTHNYRNEFNHQFPSGLLLGLTKPIMTETNNAGGVTYAFGNTSPLQFSKIISALKFECKNCYQAFEAFQVLICEQTSAIGAYIKK